MLRLAKPHLEVLKGLLAQPMRHCRETPEQLMADVTLPQTWQAPAGEAYLAECRQALDACVAAGMGKRIDRVEPDGSGSAYVLHGEATLVILGVMHGRRTVHVSLYRNRRAMLAAFSKGA